MAGTDAVEATLHLGEVFLETHDGTRISIGQLKTQLQVGVAFATKVVEEPQDGEKAEPKPIKVGSRVLISDDPKCACGITADRALEGQTGTVIAGPSDDPDGTDWYVEHAGIKNWISSEHLTVVD